MVRYIRSPWLHRRRSRAGLIAPLCASVRILKQYERGVQFRLGRLKDGPRGPGLIFVIPPVDHVRRVSLRIVTMPIQSQGIITRDNVSVDIAAVAYYRVKDPVRSVVAIENVAAAINQIAQTTLRCVVGQHTLDEALAETETINQHIREILDVQTEGGVEVTLVELNDIQLPDYWAASLRSDRRRRRPRPQRGLVVRTDGGRVRAAAQARGCRLRSAGYHRWPAARSNLRFSACSLRRSSASPACRAPTGRARSPGPSAPRRAPRSAELTGELGDGTLHGRAHAVAGDEARALDRVNL
jgi:hypothetical protein